MNEKWCAKFGDDGDWQWIDSERDEVIADGLTEHEARMAAASPVMAAALQGALFTNPDQIDWCGMRVTVPCGKCIGCIAWQAAHDALMEAGDD